ncbi:MAG TPA: glycosyltransferase [Conexibacter sp.]|jgi:glycosyltransferase involved in cell wall biosynthesis|nr:glycosyltransferase [Conexibacter sp.]
MRIAYVADPRSGNGFYRGIGPMMALERVRGHQVRAVPINEGSPPLAAVRDVDVLHIHRYGEEGAVGLAREAKAHGAAVVWDNDDDIGSVPKGTPGYRRHGGMMWEKRLAGMRKIFQIADLVTAPSRGLVERLREYGAPHAEVVENQVPDDFVQRSRPPREGVTIGWIAGLEHQLDVERMPIREALQQLLDERPEVRVVSFGLGLGLRSERYRHVDVVPLLELTRAAAAFDVGIAPLTDHPMNRARSNVKLKEYAAAGAAWLASPIGPYVGMGEKQGGRLVSDDEWHAALARLVDKPRERAKLAKRATKWVAGETLSKNARTWEARFEEAIARAGAAPAVA